MWLILGVGPWVLAGLCWLSARNDGYLPDAVIALPLMAPWSLVAWIILFAKRPAPCKDAPVTVLMVLTACGLLLLVLFFSLSSVTPANLLVAFGTGLLLVASHIGMPGWVTWLWGADRADRLTFGPPKPPAPTRRPSRANDIITILTGIAIPQACITIPLVARWTRDGYTLMLQLFIAMAVACGFATLAILIARRARFCWQLPAIVATYAMATTTGLLITLARLAYLGRTVPSVLCEALLVMWLVGMPALAMVLWAQRRARSLA